MLVMRSIVPIVIGLMVLTASTASGQTYPNKPIRIINGAVGGQSDTALRQIAPGLTEGLGQQVIVDNRNGNLPSDIVSKALPDGYTLLTDSFSFWITPLLQTTSYDPVKDFSPITLISSAPSVLVVNASLPANSIKELVALAKTKPGALNYGSGGTGSSSHLAAELLNSLAGIKITHIPFKGAAGALTALLGNEIQFTIISPGAAMGNVKAGRLKILAVTSAQPTALVPGVPTVAAAGLPGYEITQSVAMFAPAKTPDAVINRVNQEAVRVLNRADVKERFFNNGSEVRGSSPGELSAVIKTDVAKWSKVIKDAGIRGD